MTFNGMGTLVHSASVESYAHKAAKATMLSWLRDASVDADGTSAAGLRWRVNRGAPYFGVWEEYPIVSDEDCCVWDETEWWLELDGIRHHGDAALGRALLCAGSSTFRRFSKRWWDEDTLAMEFWHRLEREDYEDVCPWLADRQPIPTYGELIELGTPPKLILDIAVQHKGSIIYGIEIVHKHGITEKKRELLSKLNCATYVVSADWVLSQVTVPSRLVILEAVNHSDYCADVEMSRARA